MLPVASFVAGVFLFGAVLLYKSGDEAKGHVEVKYNF